MLKIPQVITLLVCVWVSGERAVAESWVDHQDWFKRWGVSHDSYLVTHFEESPIRATFRHVPQQFTAEGIAVIYQHATMEEVSSALQKELPPNLAIQVTETKSDVSLDRAWDYEGVEDGIVKQNHERWKKDLGSLGIRLRPLRAIRLSTKPYHIVPARSGNSIATFLLFDGNELFGNPCTLLVVYRTDRVRQWGWKSIHDVFSFGHEIRTIDIITNTETAIVGKVGHFLGRGAAVFSFPYAQDWYADVDLWRDFRSACQKAGRENQPGG